MPYAERENHWANLMRAAMSGDAPAYRRLLLDMTPHLRSMAHRRCDQFGVPTSEAEDVVQEVLLTIHLKRGSWDPDRAIGPWLAVVVRNKLIDFLRRRGRHAVIPIEDIAETLGVDEGSALSDRLDIDRILRKLGDPQRTIVRSISVEGVSVREMALQLKMSEVAVRVSLHRALKALSAKYGSRSDEDK